jgi:hypothetical protein
MKIATAKPNGVLAMPFLNRAEQAVHPKDRQDHDSSQGHSAFPITLSDANGRVNVVALRKLLTPTRRRFLAYLVGYAVKM